MLSMDNPTAGFYKLGVQGLNIPGYCAVTAMCKLSLFAGRQMCVSGGREAINWVWEWGHDDRCCLNKFSGSKKKTKKKHSSCISVCLFDIKELMTLFCKFRLPVPSSAHYLRGLSSKLQQCVVTFKSSVWQSFLAAGETSYYRWCSGQWRCPI